MSLQFIFQSPSPLFWCPSGSVVRVSISALQSRLSFCVQIKRGQRIRGRTTCVSLSNENPFHHFFFSFFLSRRVVVSFGRRQGRDHHHSHRPADPADPMRVEGISLSYSFRLSFYFFFGEKSARWNEAPQSPRPMTKTRTTSLSQ